MNGSMSLRKGIIIIFGANILNLIFNLLTNFCLPKYLSVDCYAEIKTFQLYVSYVGILHLGYEDGMYIKYGGCKIGTIDEKELKADLNTLLLFQMAVSLLLLIGAIALGSVTLTACALAVFPLNVASYYKLLFQAIGEFEAYANISNVATIVTFVANIGLLLLNFFNKYEYYLGAYVIIDFLIMSFCILIFQKKRKWTHSEKPIFFSWKIMFDNIKSGFFLMLGNFSSMLLTGMDRWFIKALMNNTAFAMYSFAVSMEGLMNVATTPISTTLYNYFCSHSDKAEIKKIRGIIILFATAIVACAFPAKFVLEIFLQHYLDASGVIFYLFAAQIFYIIVKCFYVNLYKAQKKQKKYFIKLVMVIIICFISNVICYALLHSKEAFAIGTLLCGVIWFVLSEEDFKQFRCDKKEVFYLLITTFGYLLIGLNCESIVGLVLYSLLLLISAAFFMKEYLWGCIKMVKTILGKGGISLGHKRN